MEAIDLAKAVAEHLPEYQPKESHCRGVNVSLEHKSGDGRSIFICQQDRKKWQASVTWQSRKGVWYQPETDIPSIGVSKHRGVETLAKEITRRLLPAYNAEFPKQQAIMDRHVKREIAQIALRDELLEMIDPGRPCTMEGRLQVPAYNSGIGEVRISGDTVELHTNYLPAAVARKVIQLLIDEGLQKPKDR